MKKWKDANEVIKMVHDLDTHKLRQLDREMTKKPNFEHNADVDKKVKRKYIK